MDSEVGVSQEVAEGINPQIRKEEESTQDIYTRLDQLFFNIDQTIPKDILLPKDAPWSQSRKPESRLSDSAIRMRRHIMTERVELIRRVNTEIAENSVKGLSVPRADIEKRILEQMFPEEQRYTESGPALAALVTNSNRQVEALLRGLGILKGASLAALQRSESWQKINRVGYGMHKSPVEGELLTSPDFPGITVRLRHRLDRDPSKFGGDWQVLIFAKPDIMRGLTKNPPRVKSVFRQEATKRV